MDFHFDCRLRFTGGFSYAVAFDSAARVTALFGPSGAGKTTTLELIAGLVRPAQGQIRLSGRVLLDTDERLWVEPRRRDVALVPQDGRLFPHLRVRDNLLFGFRRRGKRVLTGADVDRATTVLELAPLMDRFPRAISGGERQRVALGRALLSGAKLLLLDEPLGALDQRLRIRILGFLERVVHEWRLPAIYVTHSQAEARRLAEFVVVVERGRVVGAGEPHAALGAPRPLEWTGDEGLVNLLRLDQVVSEPDGPVGVVSGRRLLLPPAPAGAAPPDFVEFSPGAVLLSRGASADISARNHLAGVVRRLVEVGGRVFVAVDVGQLIWATLTPQAVRDLGLAANESVTVIIKTHSLTFVP
jgi:molybdate transport system ATP-binding protein